MGSVCRPREPSQCPAPLSGGRAANWDFCAKATAGEDSTLQQAPSKGRKSRRATSYRPLAPPKLPQYKLKGRKGYTQLSSPVNALRLQGTLPTFSLQTGKNISEIVMISRGYKYLLGKPDISSNEKLGVELNTFFKKALSFRTHQQWPLKNVTTAHTRVSLKNK